ncbi:putative leucine-rich repeat receptor-like protein kinase, partial [Quercus suber]
MQPFNDIILVGEVPVEIGNLQNLMELTLANNSLTGVIPNAIFNNSKIEFISLYMNQLSGHLPSSIGNWLPNLKVIYLWDNDLNGTIPHSISNASKLTALELGMNYISGSIPNTLGNLKHLERLNLVDNLLTRESSNLELSFLSSLTNCKNLTTIVLADNPLNGTLPISIGNFSTSLKEFVAFDCSIKGNIPIEIGANLLKRGEVNFNARLDCMLFIMKLAMDFSTKAPEKRINMRDVHNNNQKYQIEISEGCLRRLTTEN